MGLPDRARQLDRADGRLVPLAAAGEEVADPRDQTRAVVFDEPRQLTVARVTQHVFVAVACDSQVRVGAVIHAH